MCFATIERHALPSGTFGRVIFIPTVFGAIFLDSLMTGCPPSYPHHPLLPLDAASFTGTLVNVMGLTQTEEAVLTQCLQNSENSEHRNAAAGYMSAWMR